MFTTCACAETKTHKNISDLSWNHSICETNMLCFEEMNHDLCTSLCDAFLCLKQWLHLLKLKYSSPFCQTHINKNTRCIQNSDWTTKQLTSTWFFFQMYQKRNSMYRTISGDQTQYLKGSFTHSCCALYTAILMVYFIDYFVTMAWFIHD